MLEQEQELMMHASLAVHGINVLFLHAAIPRWPTTRGES